MKTKLLLCTMISILTYQLSFSQTAEEICKKSMDLISIESFEMLSTLTIYDAKGNERVRKFSTANRKFGDVNKTLMKFTSPSEVQGTAILIHNYTDKEADMWIYMPSLRKVRRIAGNEKASNFMGSEFKNTDMSAPQIKDFNYKSLGTSSVDGKACFKIEITPKTTALASSYGFAKQITLIEKDTYFARKVEFYDQNGKLQRTQTISDYKKQSGNKYFAHYLEMKNEQNGRKSVIRLEAFQLGSQMAENVFSPAMLEN